MKTVNVKPGFQIDFEGLDGVYKSLRISGFSESLSIAKGLSNSLRDFPSLW